MGLKPKLVTEINLSHPVVGEDLVSITLGEYLSLVHDVSAVADTERFANVVIGDEHTDPAATQVSNDVLYIDN